MAPRPDRNQDPLLKEMEDALQGVNLQDLDERGEMPAKPGARKGREKHLLRGTVTGLSGSDASVELGPLMQAILPASCWPFIHSTYRFTNPGGRRVERGSRRIR